MTEKEGEAIQFCYVCGQPAMVETHDVDADSGKTEAVRRWCWEHAPQEVREEYNDGWGVEDPEEQS